jgi:hypothetical protein
MVRGTGRATKVLGATSGLIRPLIGMLGSRLAALDRVQQLLGRSVGMLELGYGESAILPCSEGPRGGWAIGQRLPNEPLEGGRLHDHVPFDGHTVFDLDAGRVHTARGTHALPPDSTASLRALAGAGLVLVRPDRVVAALGDDLASLASFPPAARALAGLDLPHLPEAVHAPA